jgi:hypothetical protein
MSQPVLFLDRGVVALLGLAADFYGLFFYFVLALLSKLVGLASVDCCVCVGFHRTPQQPLASLNWLLSKVKRSSAYTCVLG